MELTPMASRISRTVGHEPGGRHADSRMKS
jgi:hypothetical protein